MQTNTAPQRKPRADVIRNRAAILDTAQRHFQQHGVSTSLEAVAKDAGVGPGTLYRHFPTREALLAAVLQLHTQALLTRHDSLTRIADPDEALRQWMQAMEDYLSAFSGLPQPLMAAARASEGDNPLTHPCDQLISMTDAFLQSAQQAGHARRDVGGRDLFMAASAVAWIRGTGCTDQGSLGGLRTLIESGYRCPLPASTRP